jgi:hypothetical protein
MTLAYDNWLRLEGGSDPMKIQVRVGPSRIAGQGLFAAQDIPKGTRIIQSLNQRPHRDPVAPEPAAADVLDPRHLSIVPRLFVPVHCARGGGAYPDQLSLVLVATQCCAVLRDAASVGRDGRS